MSSQRPNYLPLTARHKRIFAIAAAAAIVLVVAFSLARLSLIYWWLASCELESPACTWAEYGFTWWWAPMIIGILLLAFLAHRLTADRLRTE